MADGKIPVECPSGSVPFHEVLRWAGCGDRTLPSPLSSIFTTCKVDLSNNTSKLAPPQTPQSLLEPSPGPPWPVLESFRPVEFKMSNTASQNNASSTTAPNTICLKQHLTQCLTPYISYSMSNTILLIERLIQHI